jgi:hypothetical protein
MLNFKDRLRVQNKLIRLYELELEAAKYDIDIIYIQFIEVKLTKAKKTRDTILFGKFK